MAHFIHSSDWQLGARFPRFGKRAELLRATRLATLRRALETARNEHAEAFVVAGDLFEDNLVSDSLVSDVIALFDAFDSCPILVVPGNHDPYTGPDCVWERPVFKRASKHVHVFRENSLLDLGGSVLWMGAPLTQKISTIDPTLRLAEISSTCPLDGRIRVGISHGSPAIEGRYKPNDFPIALHAATRAGLDYLALGHWHGWLPPLDNGRMMMPGTPEPDRFDSEGAGNVARVEIAGPGALPNIMAIPVATLTWLTLRIDLVDTENALASLDATLPSLNPERSVVRVSLEGAASPSTLSTVTAHAHALLERFPLHVLEDRSVLALNDQEKDALRLSHPIIARALADIDRIEQITTGRISTSTTRPETPMDASAARDLLSRLRIDPASLADRHFDLARNLLLQHLAELSR